MVTLLGINPDKQIIILGRSIGSGPAILLASQRACAALVLFAPFTSLKDVVSANNSVGASVITPNMFNNLALISQTDCPTFIIHGSKDELVPLSQSELLIQRSGALPMSKKLHVAEDMTHKEFNMMEDVIIPSTQFLAQENVLGSVAYGKPIDAFSIKENATPPDAMLYKDNYD